MSSHPRPLQLRRVCLRDIKCFTQVELEFSHDADQPPWSVIVGDNATGKTALLRSIALGLCDESSAAGLMKESEEGYLRRDANDGMITVELVDPDQPGSKNVIETTITRVTAGAATHERLSQRTSLLQINLKCLRRQVVVTNFMLGKKVLPSLQHDFLDAVNRHA